VAVTARSATSIAVRGEQSPMTDAVEPRRMHRGCQPREEGQRVHLTGLPASSDRPSPGTCASANTASARARGSPEFAPFRRHLTISLHF
jgi:proline racemase